MHLKKKIVLNMMAAFLSGAMVAPTVSVGMVAIANEQTAVAEEAASDNGLANADAATEESLKDEAQVTIIVKLKEEEEVDASAWKTEEGIQERTEATKEIRQQTMDELQAEGLEFEPLMEYDLLFNGFSAKTDYETAKKIQENAAVESVEVSVDYNRPEEGAGLADYQSDDPLSVDSNNVISVSPAWEAGYKGEGMVVAVIDSGLDVNHDVLKVTDMEKAKFKDHKQMEAKMAEMGIPYGKWYNDKVVFGYNYNDLNLELKEKSPTSHGMHVSGIAVGNPSKDISIGEKVVGVAPEAQLMFMRVFSDINTNGTSSFIYAKAIEDAVKLGADSINMSLGSATGNVKEVGPAVSQAIQLAKDAGVIVAIAAGNDTAFGEGYSTPDADKPDYGIVANPSVAKDSISVASVNNQFIISDAANIVEVAGGKKTQIQIETPSADFPTGNQNYVYVGTGEVDAAKGIDEFKDKTLTGKIALIMRGKITFAEKVRNAKNAGAIGVIIFNRAGEEGIIGMSLEGTGTGYPVTSIGFSHGNMLAQATDGTFSLEFDGSVQKKANTAADQISDFTSWGLSSDGELKPDVTAPGGGIYSSINDGKYASQNGTSMASPHIAGVAALVKQSLSVRHPELTGARLQDVMKLLIMSTADPHYNKIKKAYTSPRQQGAGVANVQKAISGELYITNTANGYGSVSLGNVQEKFTFTVEVHNMSKEERVLTYVTDVMTDEVDQNGKFTLAPKAVASIPGDRVTVPANSSVKVPITVNTEAQTAKLLAEMPNGYYLDGFVRFVDPVDAADVVSIPFTGFRGSFENLPVLEKPIYDFDLTKEVPFYYLNTATGQADQEKHYTHLVTQESFLDTNTFALQVKPKTLGEFLDYKTGKTYYDTSRMALSPNGDQSYEKVALNAVFLRNYENFQMRVYNEQGDIVYRSAITSGLKNYYANKKPKSAVVNQATWNGTDDNGNKVPDGKYKYEVVYRAETPGAKMQSLSYDIAIDTKAPEFTGGRYDAAARTYYPHKILETGTGIQYQAVRYTDPVSGEQKDILPEEDGSFKIPDGLDYSKMDHYAIDWAGNENDARLRLQNVGDVGTINVEMKIAGYTSDLMKYVARYQIKNSKGEIVVGEMVNRVLGLDELGNVISKKVHRLPFGEVYTVELLLVDTDAIEMTSPLSFTVELTGDNAVQTVSFTARERYLNKLTVAFDEEVPTGTKVIVTDTHGVQTELELSKFLQTVYEKNFENGTYIIDIIVPEGYAVDQSQLTYVVKNGTNLVQIDIDRLADRTELTALIAAVKDVDLSDKTEASKAGFTTELAAAQAVEADTKATEEQIKQAHDALKTAFDELTVDLEIVKGPLAVAVAKAQAVDLSEKTDESAAVLTTALKAAEKALADPALTAETVAEQVKAVEAALAQLEEKKVDKKGLMAAFVEAINAKIDDKTIASVTALTAARDAAKAVLLNDAADQATVDRATAALTTALSGLALKTGWVQNPKTGVWKYVNADGTEAANQWVGSYYIKANGEMAENEWIYDKTYQGWYFLKKGGAYASKQWQGAYYLKADGKMAESQWIYDDHYKAWYYLQAGGAYAREQWIGVYYVKANGKMAVSEWIYDKKVKAWYYVLADGKKAVNTTVPDGSKVDATGKYIG